MKCRNPSCQKVKQGLTLSHFTVMLCSGCLDDFQSKLFQVSPNLAESATSGLAQDNFEPGNSGSGTVGSEKRMSPQYLHRPGQNTCHDLKGFFLHKTGIQHELPLFQKRLQFLARCFDC